MRCCMGVNAAARTWNVVGVWQSTETGHLLVMVPVYACTRMHACVHVLVCACVLVCMHVCVRRRAHRHPEADDVAARCKPGLSMAAALVFLVGPACSWLRVQPPPLLVKVLAIAGAVVLGWRILAFRRWRDEHRHVPLFIGCFLAMLVELSAENGLVWLVSAWDRRKYEHVPGLQDNGQLAAEALMAGRPRLARLLHARWANILHFLAAILALAFSVVWDQVPYSGFGIMARVTLTICCSRALRVVCFMSTVLPSPRPGCYARRFPPAPDGLWDTLKLGYTTIRGFGGCNDLVFSGHGAFWVLAPLAYRSYYPKYRAVQALLWLALAHTSLKDVLDLQHYSVDMVLAVVVTWAVWDWLAWLHPPARPLPRRAPGAAPDPLSLWVVGLILVGLAVAGVIVIGGRA